MGITFFLEGGVIQWQTRPSAVKTVVGSSFLLRKSRTIILREVFRIQNDVSRAVWLERGKTQVVEDEEVDAVLVDVAGKTDGRSKGKARRAHRSCPEAFSYSGETGRYTTGC